MNSERVSDSTASRADAKELPDDPRLMRAVEEYLAQLEAGQLPNRQEILRRYPDLREALSECLDGLELVHKAALRKSQPAAAPAAVTATPADSATANPLGDFQLIREIGRGGMGIVYEALQLSLGRRVAVKVLPFAATFDARHLQRFHNEAQAAARLHHTNIVPVYAVGVERGVHFYAMQLIEGQSLAALIEEMKPQRADRKGDPSADLSIQTRSASAGGKRTTTGLAFPNNIAANPERGASGAETASPISLALTTQRSSQHGKFFATVTRFMVQAAEAVEHAHQFGIVHRDIKPANLLVDVHHRLWITDFGLAQLNAEAGPTQTGDILGTLRYMSPEQASGKKVLDHRTDIYSLGATLYELVTLEPIFPGRNRHELLHKIINDEPKPPRALERSIPIELETIILKAVSKNPAERYATAQEFAADLGRYLEDKPILAKRPTLMERLRKWSRRHPSVVAATVVVLLVCLVGSVVSNWMIAQEQTKTHQALQNEKQRALEARRAVDLLVDIADEEFAYQPFLQGTRKRLLQAALVYYRDLLNTQGEDEGAQAALKAGNERVRSLLAELSTLEGLNLVRLAMQADVERDLEKRGLEITEDQRIKLKEFEKTLDAQSADLFKQHKLGSPEYRLRQLELTRQQQATLKEILGEGQLNRLQQIDLQSQGPRAFHESSAVDALNLTPDQMVKIRRLQLEAMGDMWSRSPGKKGPPPGKGPKDRFQEDRIIKAELDKVIAVLTPAQKRHWDEMIGPAFEGELRPFFGDFFKKGGGPKGGKGPH